MDARTPTPDVSALPRPALRLLPLVAIVCLGFLCIGLPLPVLPVYVHEELGFGTVTAGWVVGIQSLATILTRRTAGRIVDGRGAKRAVLVGLPLAALAGLFYLAATLLSGTPALAVLLLGRLLLGLAESLFLTGTMAWGIARVGPLRTGMVMAWQGIAMFVALGAGAPLGLWVMGWAGFRGVALVTLVLPLLALAVALLLPAVPASGTGGRRVSFAGVIGLIWRQGLALALASVPFAVLGGFIALFYGSQGWSRAGLAMSGFAAGYIVVRLFLAHLPDRMGGRTVGIVSVVIEIFGQLLLWLAPNAGVALLGATVTGIGFSLVFPALGIEAVRRVPPESRGLAVGAFLAFVDVANGLTGPLAGALAALAGYPALFLAGAVTCLAALGLMLTGWRAE
ncbi:MFS transporter [Roseomonas sp. BN140053]|uniref:MFS transporter n=1 Tax=Roseomonas sp. BN140053 TaxID=3391898 RepID=UPI0039ED536B